MCPKPFSLQKVKEEKEKQSLHFLQLDEVRLSKTESYN